MMQDISMNHTDTKDSNMKIAISVKDVNPETELDQRFGRCAYFWIYDTVSGAYSSIENTAANDSGGAGTAAAKLISDQGVTTVISGNYGPNAVKALQAFGIQMLVSAEEKVWTVIDKYKLNLLQEVSQPTSEGLHHK
jgi:predicted Fe-Mo cluster-binding NifX family protein